MDKSYCILIGVTLVSELVFFFFFFCKSLTLQELLDKQLTHWEFFSMQGQNYFSQSSIYNPPFLKLWIYLSLDFYHVKLLSVIHPCVCARVFSVKLQCREHWFCCVKGYYALNRNDNLPFIIKSDLCGTAMILLLNQCEIVGKKKQIKNFHYLKPNLMKVTLSYNSVLCHFQ